MSMSEDNRREREDRAVDALLVSVLRQVDKDEDDIDPKLLPQLTEEEKAAMDALGPNFVERLLAGAGSTPPSNRSALIDFNLCAHAPEFVIEGPRIPHRWGSGPCQVCTSCGGWRSTLHAPGPWWPGPLPSKDDEEEW